MSNPPFDAIQLIKVIEDHIEEAEISTIKQITKKEDELLELESRLLKIQRIKRRANSGIKQISITEEDETDRA